MTPEQFEALRKPFAPEDVGKLPRVWCGQCRQAPNKVCQSHKRVRCAGCGNNMTEAHLHLDYVGHAETTDRLLSVDPEWTWEPFAVDANGLPALASGGLWIRLTVAGVTRIGFGSADGKTGPDAVKELIGDAIRNAAMRFGVALDLWGASYKGGPDGTHDEPDPQEELFGQFVEEVDRATDAATIREIGQRAKNARDSGRLSANRYDRLDRHAGARVATFVGGSTGATPDNAGSMTDATRRKMFALWRDLGYDGDENQQQRRDVCAKLLKHPVPSVGALSEAAALAVVAGLEKRKRETVGAKS